MANFANLKVGDFMIVKEGRNRFGKIINLNTNGWYFDIKAENLEKVDFAFLTHRGKITQLGKGLWLISQI